MLARNLFEANAGITASKLPAGLYVVATPIGHLGDITLRALVTLAQVDRIACEDTRVSGGMLAKYAIDKTLLPYHDHNADKQRPLILQYIAAGEAVALISDAGLPLIADPGNRLVRACREVGYPVTVIPGANAALTALAGSGLPTDQFFFAGFLPPKTVARKKALMELKDIPSTLIFYESPQRLGACLADCETVLGGTRLAAVGRELTKLFEETRRGTLTELAAYYVNVEVKGEITLIIAPRDIEGTSAHDIDLLLTNAMQNNSLRDAVEAVSESTGTKKSEVYARALELQRIKP